MDSSDNTSINVTPTEFGDALRALIKNYLSSGHTYSDICRHLDGSLGWTEGAIKQFSNRSTTPRINGRLIALSLEVVAIVKKSRVTDSTVRESIDTLEAYHSKNASKSLALNQFSITESFKYLREQANDIFLPERFAFARFGRDEKKIILILVTSVKTEDGQIFTMKIKGSGGRKRVVMGYALSSFSNTYLAGIAYSVVRPIDSQEFYLMNPLNKEEFSHFCERNPVGIEHLAIANHHMAEVMPPICFTGLDGSGFPISGIGGMIREDDFERFKVPKEISSEVVCSSGNEELNQYLRSCSAGTMIPNTYADFNREKN